MLQTKYFDTNNYILSLSWWHPLILDLGLPDWLPAHRLIVTSATVIANYHPSSTNSSSIHLGFEFARQLFYGRLINQIVLYLSVLL